MERLAPLYKRVLDLLFGERSEQEKWLKKLPLAEVSKAECVSDFVSRMERAAAEKKKVFIFGDYDADGILATSILSLVLKKKSIEHGFYLPDRIKEGYGLNETAVKKAYEKGYSVLVTVDNGVKAQQALKLAKECGMEVIVTDHHMLEDEVQADLVVHPDFMEPVFQTLCGAGLVYELARAMNADDAYMLQLACTASIADAMQVTGQTRAIIQQGLLSMNNAMDFHLYSLNPAKKLDETDVAFQIAPKLNAPGRLSHRANVNNVVRYFLDENPGHIHQVAGQIMNINQERKDMTARMLNYCNRTASEHDDIIFMMDPGFHEGLIGLCAGSLCSSHQKPVIIMTQGFDGCKASMRAPAGFDCMAFLKGFDKYKTIGGHKQAAGFSLDLEDYDDFVSFLRKQEPLFKWEKEEKPVLVIYPDDITMENIQGLDVLRPFGPGFECPLFKLNTPHFKKIQDISNGKHRKYVLENGAECIHFGQSEFERSKSVLAIKAMLGKLQINEYQGIKKPVFIVEEIQYY